jgi:hypothetical protein
VGRAKCAFKETDVTRAVRAVKKAGITITRVRINCDGSIIIETGKQTNENGNDTPEKISELINEA